jgi:nuclear receptor interaction protein
MPTAHKTNIFSAKFIPNSNDEKLISASASGEIFMTNITRSLTENSLNKFACHGDKTCFELRTFQQDPFIFMSCGQDGTIKWFDLRQSSKCDHLNCNEHTLIHLSSGITAFASNPIYPFQLTCASLDGIVRLYDRRMLTTATSSANESKKSAYGLFACFSSQNMDSNCKRVTSIQYSNDGAEILVSYQPEHIYLLDWRVIKKQISI